MTSFTLASRRRSRFEAAASSARPSLDFTGGPFRARTGDPLIKSQLLYQLS